jgi:alkanesulfonate monooxygenase SsuD/methylene tetrahydromethanopterin reductase-like flavin-dependent oxidoreductase (luciferase family)
MTRYSLMMPFMPTRPEQVLTLAGFVQHGPAHRLWHGQSLLVEAYQSFTHLAGAGFRIPVGFGVTLMPMRHPLEAALQAQSLAVTTGHSVVAGFGPGARIFQEWVMGSPYRSQLGAVREYVTIVGELLRNGATRYDGEFFRCRADLPVLPRPPIEIGLGVLRPGMARLAGEVADVAVTWLTPVEYLTRVIVPALEEGARATGRPRPRLVAVVPVALALPDRDPVDVVLAGSTGHLQMAHYQDMLRRSGIDVDPDDMRRSAKEVLAGGAFLFGSAVEVADGLARYAAAGVDEIVLNATGVCLSDGLGAAVSDVRSIIDTARLGELTP